MSLILVVLMALQVGALDGQPERTAFRLNGYVLQVGAFQDETTARAVAAEINSRRLFILPIRIEQQDWWVLLYDNYATREIAARAALRFERDHPQLSTWIRPAELIRKLLRPASAAAAAKPR